MVYYLRDRKWFQHPDRLWSGGAASYFSSVLLFKTSWLLEAPLLGALEMSLIHYLLQESTRTLS